MDNPFRHSEPAQPADLPRNVRPVQSNTPFMHVPPPPPQQFSLSLGDIYYILFRHKWKILLCSLAGFVAAAALYKLKPPPYQSEAKLFIRYVTESKALGPPGDDSANRISLDRGETIINSELEILTSLDLAMQVATAVGPEKILSKLGGGNDPMAAAGAVKSGLTAEAPAHGNVLRIVYENPNPAVVQPVLREIIDSYFKKHLEIHQAVGIPGDSLTQQTDQLRARLTQTEEELRKANNKAGVISIDDSKKGYADQIARLRQEIFSAQAELAERAAVVEEFSKHKPGTAPIASTGPDPTSEQITEYRNVVARQESLQKREQDLLLSGFSEDSSRVRQVRELLADARAKRKKLEDDCPTLVRSGVAIVGATGGTNAGPVDLAAEGARLTALEAKIKVLNSQLDEIRAEASKVDQMEGTISELRRRKELEEANLKYYSARLEASRVDDTLGNSSVSNIVPIQNPSPPVKNWKKSVKFIAAAGVGGIVFGLAWAFLFELYFDRSIRRPIDVERMVRLPLFLSIPILGKTERRRLTVAAQERLSLPAPANDVPAETTNGTAQPDLTVSLANLDNGELLHPFHETLRDRLISYFESKGLTHKPKLVAVTGLGRGSGVTTTAAGLAGTLSQTGEGNVLLVDMTLGQGSAQQFYQGKAVVGIEGVLGARDSAQIQDNLFVVGEGTGSDKLSRILPQRFNQLIPKLKASNFDYIIFDMPPVSQLSITPRLAGFMDMVLMVIESEKTDQELVRRATALLAESKAHVGAVLNKTKTYVPPQLHQESLGNL